MEKAWHAFGFGARCERTLFVSKSNFDARYRDPITPLGVRLGGEELFAFHLHEAGCLTLSTQWNHPGVRSPFWRLYWSNRPGAWIECSGRRFDLGPSGLLLIPSHAVFVKSVERCGVVLTWQGRKHFELGFRGHRRLRNSNSLSDETGE